MIRTLRAFSVLTLVILATPAPLQAQNAFGRDGRWEYTITPIYSLPSGIDFEGGTHMDASGELGLAMGLGYNYGERWTVSVVFQGGIVDYDADFATGDPSGPIRVSGSYGQWTTWCAGDINLLDGPVTPYVSGALGYSWFDVGVPDGLPHMGCWWDPWYGYICSHYYPTMGVDAFSYKAGLGLRIDFNIKFFLRAGYEMQWHQLSTTEGDAGIGVWKVDFGFFF
jgi:hypothetical protein